MPIEFSCGECDRPIRVKDELAGKRIKCPGCSEAVTVPEEDAPPPPKKSGLRAAPAAPARRRAEDEEDDRPRRPARGRDDEDEDDRPRRPSRARDEDEDEGRPRKGRGRDDDEDEDDRPRKKPKKQGGSGMLMVLGIGGGVLGLLLIGGLLWWLLSGGRAGGTVNLKDWVPGDAAGFFSVRMASLNQSQHVQTLINDVKAAASKAGQPLDVPSDLKPEEIERVTAFVQTVNRPDDVLVVIETTIPIDEAKMKSSFNDVKEETHEGKKYVSGVPRQTGGIGAGKGKGPIGQRFAYHLISSKGVLYCPETQMKQALASAGKQRTGPLHDNLGLLSSGKHITTWFQLAQADTNQLKQAAAFMPAVKPYLPIAEAKSLSLTMNLATSFEIEASLSYADAGAAGTAKDALDKAIKLGTGSLAALQLFAATDPDAGAALDELIKGLGAVKVAQNGQQVTASIAFDPAPLVRGISAASRAGAGGPPKGPPFPFPKKDKRK